MEKLFGKRLWRSFKSNWLRTFSLFLIVALSCYVFVSLASSAMTVIKGIENDFFDEAIVEDGEFSLYVPLTDEQRDKFAEENNIYVQEIFNYVIKSDDGRTLRIFKNRDKLNKLSLTQGRLPSADNEIVIERLYAGINEIELGDSMEILGRSYTVVGAGALPDYIYPLYQDTDSATDNVHFSWVITTDSEYDNLFEVANTSQDYSYAFKYKGEPDEKTLKSNLNKIVFDYRSYMEKDEYFKEYINSYIKDMILLSSGVAELESGVAELNRGLVALSDYKAEILNGASDLKNGSGELSRALTDLTSNNSELNQGAADLTGGVEDFIEYLNTSGETDATVIGAAIQMRTLLKEMEDYVADYTKAVEDISAGCSELDAGNAELYASLGEYLANIDEAQAGTSEILEGVGKLLSEVNNYIDSTIQSNIKNMTYYGSAEFNRRIFYNDAKVTLTMALAIGGIVFILLAYICSITIGHQVSEESQIIGALFALGIKKGTLIRHYLITPVLTCFFGGIAGLLVGYSPIGLNFQLSFYTAYYSLPPLNAYISPLLIIYSILGPTLICLVVNLIILGKKLSHPVLYLMKNTSETASIKQVNLDRFSFMHKFQLRQMLREKKISICVFLSVLLAINLLMLGVVTFSYIQNTRTYVEKDTTYENMYYFKYPSNTEQYDGEKIYVESMLVNYRDYSCSVEIMGIPDDSKYFDVDTVDSSFRVVISKAVQTKYNLKVDDYIVLFDSLAERNYAFKVADVCDYGMSLAVFMDIDSMRSLFGQSNDFYNAVVSDKDLDIEEGRLYSVLTRDSIIAGLEHTEEEFISVYVVTIGAGLLLFSIVLYMMISMMIDRATRGISMVRIFGFDTKEIAKMYLHGIMVIVVASILIALPIDYFIVVALYPTMFASFAAGLFLDVPFYYFIIIFAFTVLLYQLILRIQMMKINKITPAVFLKTRN